MKLVIATPLYPPEIGGPATYAKLLEEGLPGKGIEVETVKFSDVRHLPKFIRHYAYYRRVLRAARNADAILALDPVSVGLPALKAAKKLGKPYAVKIVGDYAWEQGQQRFGIIASLDEFVRTKNVPFPVKMLRRVQTETAREADLVIVPSEYLKSIVSVWGIPPEKIHVVYNAIRTEEPGEVPEAVSRLKRPLIVTAGRLVPWKRMEGLIEAVARISEASLAIVGDGPLRATLEERATAMLAGRSALTGRLSHSDTLAVMASSDVFVLNSSYEGLSHLLVEALMLGIPVVATRVGGNPEVITDGANGLLVPEGDALALEAGIAHVLDDEPLRLRLKIAAKDAAKRFSLDAMINRTSELLRTL